MGKYTIVISGEGPHHGEPNVNGGITADADVLGMLLVKDLKHSGHTIHSAVFNTETTTDDLDALTRPGNETLLYGGAAAGGMAGQSEGAQNDNPGSGGPGADAPTPNAMKVFEFEAKDGDNVLDTLYVQGETEEAARQTFKDRGFDDVPESMLSVREIPELPEDEELLNPA